MRPRAAAPLPPQDAPGAESPEAARPPGHRQFTARGLRLPAAVTITICKGLPADAHRADPSAPRGGRARGAPLGVPRPRAHREPRGPLSPTNRGVSCDTAKCLRRCSLSPGPYRPSGARRAPRSRAPAPTVLPRTRSPSTAPRGARGHPFPVAASRGPSPLLHFLRRRPLRRQRIPAPASAPAVPASRVAPAVPSALRSPQTARAAPLAPLRDAGARRPPSQARSPPAPKMPEVGDARTHPNTTSSPYFTGSLLGAQFSSWPGDNMEPRSAAAAAASAATPAESAPPLQSHPEKGVSAPGKGTAAKGARGGQSRGCSVVAARLPRRAPQSSASRGRPEPD